MNAVHMLVSLLLLPFSHEFIANNAVRGHSTGFNNSRAVRTPQGKKATQLTCPMVVTWRSSISLNMAASMRTMATWVFVNHRSLDSWFGWTDFAACPEASPVAPHFS